MGTSRRALDAVAVVEGYAGMQGSCLRPALPGWLARSFRRLGSAYRRPSGWPRLGYHGRSRPLELGTLPAHCILRWRS